MTTWHAPPHVLTRYATSPEALDQVTAASVEQHLLVCAACRSGVASAADGPALAASWDAVADRIDRPRPLLVERVLRRCGLGEEPARVVGATPALQACWAAAVTASVVLAVAAAASPGTRSVFLLVAPLVPVLAVALAFVAAADPAGEAGVATALHGATLAMHRAVAALVPAMALLGVAAASLGGEGVGVAWLLPALALALGTLALTTFVSSVRAAMALSVTWLVAVTASLVATPAREGLADSFAYGPPGQLAALAVGLAAAAVVHVRRDRFATLEVDW